MRDTTALDLLLVWRPQKSSVGEWRPLYVPTAEEQRQRATRLPDPHKIEQFRQLDDISIERAHLAHLAERRASRPTRG